MINLFRPSLAAAEPDKILIFLLRRKNRARRDAAVVLACTKLPLLIHVDDTSVRLFDTMALHVNQAVTLALSV